jgi:ABC-2 type transport system ATP-binding protein
MIEAVHLTKRFGAKAALEQLSAVIPQGSIYGLVGPNGSGKSTLMRLICGVYRPDEGQILVAGEPVYENPHTKARVFYLSDDLYFLPKSTVHEMARFYEGVYPTFDREEYQRLCGIFPIDPEARINTFSKGMRRQAALLLALSCRTRYLLLDEAFDGLDPVIRLMVKKLLAQEMESRELTVVISSHNLRELEDLCDHIGLLHRGRIQLEKELDELKLGFCKVQAAYREPVDWSRSGLSILQSQQRGSLVSMLVRGSAEETLEVLQRYQPLFAEAVPLTLEEIFIGEMEAAGYDYNNILL